MFMYYIVLVEWKLPRFHRPLSSVRRGTPLGRLAIWVIVLFFDTLFCFFIEEFLFRIGSQLVIRFFKFPKKPWTYEAM